MPRKEPRTDSSYCPGRSDGICWSSQVPWARLHRHKLVLIRSRVKNELQPLAINKGRQQKRKLVEPGGAAVAARAAAQLPLNPGPDCRREALLGLLNMLDEQIGKLDRAVEQAAKNHPPARLLMTQPGVGPNTALAFVLTLDDASRFPRGKQVASYLGLIPREQTSGGRQKLGAISKQGNRLLRSLLVEAAQTTVRYDPQFRREYLHR